MTPALYYPLSLKNYKHKQLIIKVNMFLYKNTTI